MPDRMRVLLALPQIKGHAAGVTQPAGHDPRELGGGQIGAEFFEGDQTNPADRQIQQSGKNRQAQAA